MTHGEYMHKKARSVHARAVEPVLSRAVYTVRVGARVEHERSVRVSPAVPEPFRLGYERMQSRIYISYSPDKAGSVFALFYFESGDDVIGWHIETREHYFSAAFFMIENFYAAHDVRLFRSVEDDVYGAWTIDHPPTRNLIRCPLSEGQLHELERQQSQFVEDWLFFGDDARIESELAAYQVQGLPVYWANIKWRKLHRLQKHGRQWILATPGTDMAVVQFLRKYWRLNEKVPVT